MSIVARLLTLTVALAALMATTPLLMVAAARAAG